MKIYKLLILLLAFSGLNSCTEYLDNGIDDNGQDQPETPVFKAALTSEEDVYVRDTVFFEAKLNNVDVTSTTIFKVNGVELKRDYNPKNGYRYITKAKGVHKVVATLDSFTYSFDFEVLEEDPMPTGNRIEYGGESYPVSETVWALALDANDAMLKVPVNGVDFCAWLMQSTEYDNNDNELHQFYSIVLAPINNGNPVLPYGSPSSLVHLAGGVFINGQEIFETENVDYTFGPNGNTPPTGNVGTNGTANYTGLANDEGNTKSAELFWNGDYTFYTFKPQGAKGVNYLKTIKSFNISKDQIKNLKLSK